MSLCFLPNIAEGASFLNPDDYFPKAKEIKNPFLPQFIKEDIKKTTPEKVEPKPMTTTQKKITTTLKKITRQESNIREPEWLQKTIIFPEISVSGLIWNSNRPQAIVNHEVVEAGDVVNQAKIIEITKKGITIEFDGKTKFFTP